MQQVELSIETRRHVAGAAEPSRLCFSLLQHSRVFTLHSVYLHSCDFECGGGGKYFSSAAGRTAGPPAAGRGELNLCESPKLRYERRNESLRLIDDVRRKHRAVEQAPHNFNSSELEHWWKWKYYEIICSDPYVQ